MLAWFRSDVAILYDLPRFDILKVTMLWIIAKKYTSNTSELPLQNLDEMPCPLRSLHLPLARFSAGIASPRSPASLMTALSWPFTLLAASSSK
jgi:hypothetical protein